MSGAAQLLHRDYGWKHKWVTCRGVGAVGGLIPLLLQQWCKMNQWSHQPLNSRLRSKTPIQKKGGCWCGRLWKKWEPFNWVHLSLVLSLKGSPSKSVAFCRLSHGQSQTDSRLRVCPTYLHLPAKERRKERKPERKNKGRANKPNVRSTREKDTASS